MSKNKFAQSGTDEEEKWYFSIVDIVGILSESVDQQAYWRKLKQRLKEEGNETVTNCHALKMLATDGKMRLTDRRKVSSQEAIQTIKTSQTCGRNGRCARRKAAAIRFIEQAQRASMRIAMGETHGKRIMNMNPTPSRG